MADRQNGHAEGEYYLPSLTEIKNLRESLNWTQAKLGKMCGGLSQYDISKIENDSFNCSYKTVKNIFSVLTQETQRKRGGLKSRRAADIAKIALEKVSTWDTIEDARRKMVKNDYSQLPVIDNTIVKGSITDKIIISIPDYNLRAETRIDKVMGVKFRIFQKDDSLEEIRKTLIRESAVLVDLGNKEFGIITKHDLLSA